MIRVSFLLLVRRRLVIVGFSAQLQGFGSTEVYVQRSFVVRDVRSQKTPAGHELIE